MNLGHLGRLILEVILNKEKFKTNEYELLN